MTSPPFVCIEILSKDDTMQYMQEKIDDYLHFGVPYVWIVNPLNKKAYVVTRAGMVEATVALETRSGNQHAAWRSCRYSIRLTGL